MLQSHPRTARFVGHFARRAVHLGALALLLAAPSRVARAQSVATSSQDRAVIMRADSLSWTDLGLIPGVQIAVLQGNPQDTGTYTLRLRFPAGTRMPAHWHPRVEYATLISGALRLGMGEREDSAATMLVEPGAFLIAPARMAHYGRAREETVIQLSGPGPYEVVFVDPADDPRKRAPARP
jgi:quercetin dioxygenase-like cupin family protein